MSGNPNRCQLEEFAHRARVLALPGFVLFPHATQVVRIAETVDRELVAEALETDRLVAVALLSPGWEQCLDARPPLHPFACLAEVLCDHRLPDGSWNLLLSGLKRLRIEHDLYPVKRFREARTQIVEDRYPADESVKRALRHVLRDALVEAFSGFLDRHSPVLVDHQVPHPLAATILGGIQHVRLGVLTDQIAAMLDLDLDRKAALLAQPSVARRADLLVESLADCLDDLSPGAAGRSCFPPVHSPN